MTVELDLSAIWEHMARRGQLRNQFHGPNGEKIEAGIRFAGTGLEHYAINVETGCALFACLKERPLEPSPFTLQLNQYRSIKPQARTIHSKKRRDHSPDVAKCIFACQDSSNSLSLLQRHAPIQTTLPNFQWAALPNALPVEKNGHFLWVPIETAGAVDQVSALTASADTPAAPRLLDPCVVQQKYIDVFQRSARRRFRQSHPLSISLLPNATGDR